MKVEIDIEAADNITLKNLFDEVVTGECSVELIRENEDGSADYVFNFSPEALQAFTRVGILAAIQAGIDEAKRLNPEGYDTQDTKPSKMKSLWK